jgi:hypothetical protein
LINKRSRTIVFVLIAVFVAVMIFSSGSQNATARETLSVQIQPPSETTVLVNTEVQLWANATGGSGEYYYRWSVNNVQINNNFTSATIILNETKVGTYTIGCQISDVKGIVSGTAIAPEINLFVTTEPTLVGQAPSTSPLTNSGNQDLTLIVSVVVIAAIVVSIALAVYYKRHKSGSLAKKTVEVT